MPEITTTEIKDYLSQIQGREITLSYLRKEFNILQGSKSFDAIRTIMFRLAEQKIIRPTGKHDGSYKVITQVSPVPIFSVERERVPPFNLIFPRDFNTMKEMDFAGEAVIREGDLITLGGLKSKGKTTLCINFCAENVDKHPVLMGNEYTTLVNGLYVPTPRFINRLDAMDRNKGGWVDWIDNDGNDKVTLLPVRDDYAEHIVKDRINIIDWINIATGELYMIGTILEGIKKQLGRGIAIVALQKGEGFENPRGGQFVRDFSDLEILLDGFGDNEDSVLLTLKGCKEKHSPIVGKTYAYMIGKGVKIIDFREVKKCPDCHGKGYKGDKPCITCSTKKFIDKETHNEEVSEL